MMENGIHVFVFCCSEYKHLLNECIYSIRQNIKDNVLSINIISNRTIHVDGCNLILDHEFWKKIDPDNKHFQMYNANWIKQQIFKLNVDRYVTGNVLIVDAEVLFLRPMQLVENNKHNFFTSFSPYHKPYFNLNKSLLNLDKLCEYSFITDIALFSTEVLKKIRNDIEQRYNSSWLLVLQEFLSDNNNCLSEFELYGNYVLQHCPEIINKIQQPIHHVTFMPGRVNYAGNQLLDKVKETVSTDFISVNIHEHSYAGNETKWLTFYYQVKAPNWPDCDNESDFELLPDYVKQECIEVFGYKARK